MSRFSLLWLGPFRAPTAGAAAFLFIGLLSGTAAASTSFLSYTGSLASSDAVFEATFSLSSTSNVAIQTWGFGGGTNAAGTVIAAGGFDPMVALFSGPVASAAIYTIAGNPAADADTLVNPPISFVGNCPPAGLVTIGTGAGSSVCGDDLMQISGLAAGIYTLVLTDANYIPSAVNPGPPFSTLLSDGFSDLTGGVFQTCNTTSDGTTCITPTSHFAVDVVDLSGAGLSAPEPQPFALLGIGFVALGVLRRRRQKGESR